MTDAITSVPDTGTAPATPGASPSVTPSENPVPDQKIAESAKPVVPERYEFKLGEGREVDAGLVDAVSPILKELGLSQDQATKLVSAYDKYGEVFEAQQQKDFEAYMAKTAKDNVAAIKKEWGTSFEANTNTAQRALSRFMSNEGKVLLDQYGLGNHPEILKAFYKAGLMIQEDQPLIGVPTNTKPVTFADALYGKPN
jgi:hypothetical protein